MNFKKLSRWLLSFALLFGTMALPQASFATNTSPTYQPLTFACAPGVQNGISPALAPSAFAGCTVTVYNHGTSTLSGTFSSATGGALTNPIVLTKGSGTVTTSSSTVTWVSGSDFVTTGSWVGQPITIAGSTYTITAVSGAETTLTVTPAVGTNATAVAYSVAPVSETFYAADGSYDVCVSNSGSTPVLGGVCNSNILVLSGLTQSRTAALTSAFTDANASGLQAITGLSFAFPSTDTGSHVFHCSLGFSEATPAAGVGPGVAVLTTAPTRLDATTVVYSSAAGASANAPITNLTTTTPTAGATVTPGSTVVYPIFIDGTVQLAGGGAQTLAFYIQQGTAADVVVISAGSFCTVI